MASLVRLLALLCLACTVCLSGAAKKSKADPKADFQRIGTKAVNDFQSGRLDDAFEGFRKLQELDPKNMELWIATGQVMQQKGKYQEALEEYNQAIQVDGGEGPRAWDVYSKVGEVLQQAGDGKQAAEAFDEAVRLKPTEANTYILRGNLWQQSDSYRNALADFSRATELAPSLPTAWSGLGVAMMYMEHVDAGGAPPGFGSYDEGAIHALRRTMRLNPGNMQVLSNLVMAENRVCDWDYRAKHFKQLRRALRDSAAQKRNFAPPFHAFEFGYSPKEMKVNCKYLALQVWEDSAEARAEAGKRAAGRGDPPLGKGGVLSVAYVNGAGFHNGTTTARCLQSMFSMHDRARVRVVGVAGSGDDKSPERARIRAGCDAWVDAESMTVAEVAGRLLDEGVHIVVDTTGYTMKQKTEILAVAQAPIVLSFHGFPGTMGAHFVHYLAADRLTTPPEHQAFYAEKAAIVPGTYLVNDHRQSRREVLGGGAAPRPTRAELGFGEGDVILASFNQLYKIDPDIFAVWMRVLGEVPAAKIWMLRFSHAAEAYLKASAKKHGIDPERIVFSEKFPKETELLAKGHADLFLDTPLFNAHTTGGDVLWAGVPILTLPGDNFASRVASGLVSSTQSLPGVTIARDHADYGDLAVRLCKDAARRKRLADALRGERESAPLFDTRGLTGNVEVAMRLMWDIHAAGERPMHCVVRS